MSTSGLYADIPVEKYKDLSKLQQKTADKVINCLNNLHKSKEDSKNSENPQNPSVVLGLEGSWGSGKTSIIRGIKDKLNPNENKTWEIAEYQAWNAPSPEKLQSDLLLSISSKVGLRAKLLLKKYIYQISAETKNKLYKSLVELLILLGIPVGSIVASIQAKSLYPYLAAILPLVLILSIIIRTLKGGVAGDRTRKKLEKKLLKQKNPILVVIDDVDRVTSEELCVLFKTIRNIGNLPNVYYLLAYDKIATEDLLTDTGFSNRSGDFMEKIVQYPFYLPPLQFAEICAIIPRMLKTYFDFSEDEVQDRSISDETKKLADLLSKTIKTYRGIYRLMGKLSLYDDLKNEVNAFDFIALLQLKEQFGEVYNKLPDHSKELIGRENIPSVGVC
jgi:predicted KAP-like P-loop ATPase